MYPAVVKGELMSGYFLRNILGLLMVGKLKSTVETQGELLSQCLLGKRIQKFFLWTTHEPHVRGHSQDPLRLKGLSHSKKLQKENMTS